MSGVLTDIIIEWECKVLSNRKVKASITANRSFSPKFFWMNNSKVRVRFEWCCVKHEKITFTLNAVVSLYIVYKLDKLSQDLNADFTLKGYLFGTKNVNPNKFSYSEYGIGSIYFFHIRDLIGIKMLFFLE